MAAPDPAADGSPDVFDRMIETGSMAERIDLSILERIPLLWLPIGLAAAVAVVVLWRLVHRVRVHVEKRRDPFALPGRAFERSVSELRLKIRELAGRGVLNAEEEGRWIRICRETGHAASRYGKLVGIFQTEVVEKDIQFFGDLQSRFDALVAAWKALADHARGVTASMADAEHIVNTRRRANDRLQDFLEAAKEFENQYDRVVHQPRNLRRG